MSRGVFTLHIVLFGCGLERDLALFEAGDQTEVCSISASMEISNVNMPSAPRLVKEA